MQGQQRKIVLKKANLTRSTRIVSRMNPFVKLITRRQEYRSSISKAAEKEPVWNCTEIIEVEDNENIKLQILDFNSRAEPELIAEATLMSQELLGGIYIKKVTYDNEVVGQIELSIQTKIIQQNNYIGQQTILGPQFQYP